MEVATRVGWADRACVLLGVVTLAGGLMMDGDAIEQARRECPRVLDSGEVCGVSWCVAQGPLLDAPFEAWCDGVWVEDCTLRSLANQIAHEAAWRRAEVAP
jgi:hypothetical protein